MHNLMQLFEQFEKTRPHAALFTSAKYGFAWSMDKGVIFYPEGYMSRSRAVLLHRILPDVPFCICDDGAPENGAQWSENLESAVRKFPDALLVLSGDPEWTARTIPHIADRVPADMLARVITHRQLGDFLPYGTKVTRYWDTIRKSSLPAGGKVKGKVAAAYSLFDDALSKATFLAILRRYLLSSDAIIPYEEPSNQYFSPVYAHSEDEEFVDCGAFTGDTLEQYLKIKNGQKFRKYTCLEPDKKNYDACCEYIFSLPDDIRSKIVAYPYAVGSETGTVSFSGGAGSDSCVSNDGGGGGSILYFHG